MISSVFGLATIFGPILGGALTQHVSWRWCFYIDLPVDSVGIFALIFLLRPPSRFIEEKTVIERAEKLDLMGTGLFIPSIVMVLLALQWGGNTYPWKSGKIVGLFLGFAGGLACFITWQLYRDEDAMIPIALLMRRTVVFSSLTILLAMGGSFVIIYYLPDWFQIFKGASFTHSGIMNLPMFVSQIIATLIAGVLVTKLGYPNPRILGGATLLSLAQVLGPRSM